MNASADHGITALMGAALTGKTEIVDVLLAAGADAGALNAMNGGAALHCAQIAPDNVAMIRALVKAAPGALAVHTTDSKQTPLHLAAT